MDPVSHGLVGAVAALATTTRDRKKVRTTLVVGALAAMAPDLDVLLRRTSDPLYQLELHRQFSHSLIFAPLGSAIVASMLWWAVKSRISFRQLYLACLAGTTTAGLLDACTSYGTQLLWPLSSTRVAWNLTPVVDPIFTLLLLVLVGAVFITGRRALGALAGLGIAIFLTYGAVQQSRAVEAARGLQASRGHQPTEVLAKPTLGNQILWRINYVHDGRLYADAVRTGLTPQVYAGESCPLISPRRDFANHTNTRVYRDLERFSRLSQGYLIAHPDHPDVIGDGRYAMLPVSVKPLWGLKFEPENLDAAPTFVTFRDSGPVVRQRFWAMLRGQPDPAR
jgi:inner membrane protein